MAFKNRKQNYPLYETTHFRDFREMVENVAERFPDKNIWLYTGYLYEDLKDLSIMDYIDVLVDGPFIEAEKDLSLAFRGSRNQRIIDVPASRSSGSVILKLL